MHMQSMQWGHFCLCFVQMLSKWKAVQTMVCAARPHTALPQGPKAIYLRVYWKSEDIYMTASTAEPLCHSQRHGPLSPRPQAGIEHQETVHMTLKHRQDKVQFLKGRFIWQVSLSAIHLKGNHNTMKDLNQGLRISYKHQDQNPKVLVLRLKFSPLT